MVAGGSGGCAIQLLGAPSSVRAPVADPHGAESRCAAVCRVCNVDALHIGCQSESAVTEGKHSESERVQCNGAASS